MDNVDVKKKKVFFIQINTMTFFTFTKIFSRSTLLCDLYSLRVLTNFKFDYLKSVKKNNNYLHLPKYYLQVLSGLFS